MGWTGSFGYLRAPRGKERIRAAINAEGLEYSTEGRSCSVVDSALVGNVVYLALHLTNTSKKQDIVLGCVVLTEFRYGEFRTKVITEDMGPLDCKCPLRILKQLSPTEDEWALHWRECCREWHARDRSNEPGELPIGAVIQLRNSQRTLLAVTKNNRGRRCYLGNGVRASAQAIKSWGYDIVK